MASKMIHCLTDFQFSGKYGITKQPLYMCRHLIKSVSIIGNISDRICSEWINCK